MSSSWSIQADWDRCIGSGSCAFTAPEVFDVDDSGRVVLVGPVTGGDERIKMAVESCPTSALRLIKGDAEGDTEVDRA